MVEYLTLNWYALLTNVFFETKLIIKDDYGGSVELLPDAIDFQSRPIEIVYSLPRHPRRLD